MEIAKILRYRIYTILALLIGLFLFDILATKLALYWTYRWFDIPMHFIGGALVSWCWLIFVAWRTQTLKINWMQALWGTFLIGVAWEILEFYMKVSQVVPEYAFDTIKDLLMDMIGGLVAYTVWDLQSKNSDSSAGATNNFKNNAK